MDTPWSQEDIELLFLLKGKGKTWEEISNYMGKSKECVRSKFRRYKKHVVNLPKGRLPESILPSYDDYLEITGDVLILPDLEIPYHEANFVNVVIDLAKSWGINQVVLGGDAIHFESLSTWSVNWGNGKMTFSEDVSLSKKILHRLQDCFDTLYFMMGNHEARLIRTLDSHLIPEQMLDLFALDKSKWIATPYYYLYLTSEGNRYLITHPAKINDNAAINYASMYHCNILMCHSHKYRFDFDPSGKYIAAHIGCCVDERKLAYRQIRMTIARKHILGAVIIRNGYCWMLNEKTDFETLIKGA